jgi:hypothetical protein
MRNNPLNGRTSGTWMSTLAIFACAAAFAALVGCSSGSGDPSPAQPPVTVADFIGHLEEDAGDYPFNVTIEAGETPGTATFVAPFDRCVGTVSLSGSAATLTAHAAAFFNDGRVGVGGDTATLSTAMDVMPLSRVETPDSDTLLKTDSPPSGE